MFTGTDNASKANRYHSQAMSASSHETTYSSNFSIFSSQSQISNAMSAELLEDMSIIDDLYNEYSDADDPNEMGKHITTTLSHHFVLVASKKKMLHGFLDPIFLLTRYAL